MDSMDETIRIRSVDRSDWSSVLQGFQPETIEQLLDVYGSEGQKIGTICEGVDGKSYINGQPETNYANLQAAAAALMRSEIASE